MKILTFANQKGGVGKTTSAINVSAALTELGYKVIAIDMDPQANLTLGLGEKTSDPQTTIYDCLIQARPFAEALLETAVPGLRLLPANINLANAEFEMSGMPRRERRLHDAIIAAGESLHADFIIIDPPPSLGLLTLNALSASDGVVVPIETGIFAMSGVDQLLSIINLVKKKINPRLSILGVLLTKFDGRSNLAKEIVEEIKEIFNDKLLSGYIHQSIKLGEAQRIGQPICKYQPKSRVAIEYAQAAKELSERVK